MLPKLVAAAALCAALALSACQTAGPAPPLPPERPAVTTTSRVAAAVRAACGYRVAAATVLALVETYRGQAVAGTDLAADIAAGICASVRTAYASDAAPTFRGVAIRSAAR